MPSPEATDLALDAALLVGASLARQAEEGIEVEVRTEQGEAVGLDPIAALQHPGHRAREVVIADPGGQTPEAFEGDGVALEEGGLLGCQEGQRDRLARAGQAQVKEVDLGGLSSKDDGRLAEVDLGLLTRWVAGHDGHRADGRPELRAQLAHVLADRRLGDHGTVLLDQALPDPPCRVALLAWRRSVLIQPGADDRLQGIHQRGRPRWHDTGRWQGRRQCLAHGPPMDVVLTRQRADGHPLLPLVTPDTLE